MNTFSLSLLDSNQVKRFDNVTQCVAADVTGAFGVLAGHEHLVAVLRYGLLRFFKAAESWHYVSLPGGVLRFAENQLTVVTSRFFLGDNAQALMAQLQAEIAREDSDIRNARSTLAQIEHTLLRRLSELGRQGVVNL